MGGSGVIKEKALLARRPALALLAELLDYPTGSLQSAAFLQETVAAFQGLPEAASVLAALTQLQQQSLPELEEEYTRLFELNKKLTLYCTYYKLEDSRKRGDTLAKLKVLYESFGSALAQPELADYLPAMLEFLAYGDFLEAPHQRELLFMLAVIEDGTYHMLKEAEESPYVELLRSTRQLVRACIDLQEVAVQ